METTSPKELEAPQGFGITEDSGFSSIAGSITDVPIKEDPDASSIAQDIKFRTVNVKEMFIPETGKKRKRTNLKEREEKKQAKEAFDNEQREQTYKRLMHLLTRSKFYSSYIIDKLNAPGTNSNEQEEKTKMRKVKKERKETNENAAPTKRARRARKASKKYDIKEYVSSDMRKTLDDQKKKLNMSQEEIEAELNSQSDSEEKAGAAGSTDFVRLKYFKGTLRDYQKEGVQWLKVLYENGVNGILADEMGLGKTIQVIAMFCHLLENRQDGPYLIVAPLSTIPNWLIEFERFAPNLPVVRYCGKPEDRLAAGKKMFRKHPVFDGYSTYPIVLTTYEYPLRDRQIMSKLQWRYIVVDEGQRLKNWQCQLIRSLRTFKSLNRLLLTGTPLQNNLSELWSLLNFLLPEIFNDLVVFESWFDAKELQENEGTQKVLKQEEEKHVLSTLREILKPFMLRRLKTEVCTDVPPKKEIIVYAPLTELQFELYGAVLNYDLEALSKIENPPLIIPESELKLKRRCTMHNKLSSNYIDIYNRRDDGPSRSTSPTGENNKSLPWNFASENQSFDTKEQSDLEEWRKYTDVSDRNRDFFVRIRYGNRTNLYKQIVNHPYLLHCPLDHSGRPEISENLVKASGKLLVLDAMLKKLKEQGHKVLLFSTMTMILDLIADYLSLRPWEFLMLDGRHDIDTRQVSIKSFNEDPEIFLFLISTRAGGVGLNLAAADTVIIYDSDWNPQCDLQAMARCHRIGQTRPVVVYRLCTKGTVDERIMTRAQAKRKLEKMVMSKETGLDLKNGHTLKELKRLLDSTEHTVVAAEKEVYTEAELDKILDRSDLVWPTIKEEAASGGGSAPA